MKKKILVVLSIFMISILAGCVEESKPNNSSTTTDDKNGINPIKSSSEWCKPGKKSESKTDNYETSAEVIGITEFKGRTLCQMETKSLEKNTNKLTTTTLYMNEEGTYTYSIVKDQNGNIIKEGESKS